MSQGGLPDGLHHVAMAAVVAGRVDMLRGEIEPAAAMNITPAG